MEVNDGDAKDGYDGGDDGNDEIIGMENTIYLSCIGFLGLKISFLY